MMDSDQLLAKLPSRLLSQDGQKIFYLRLQSLEEGQVWGAGYYFMDDPTELFETADSPNEALWKLLKSLKQK